LHDDLNRSETRVTAEIHQFQDVNPFTISIITFERGSAVGTHS